MWIRRLPGSRSGCPLGSHAWMLIAMFHLAMDLASCEPVGVRLSPRPAHRHRLPRGALWGMGGTEEPRRPVPPWPCAPRSRRPPPVPLPRARRQLRGRGFAPRDGRPTALPEVIVWGPTGEEDSLESSTLPGAFTTTAATTTAATTTTTAATTVRRHHRCRRAAPQQPGSHARWRGAPRQPRPPQHRRAGRRPQQRWQGRPPAPRPGRHLRSGGPSDNHYYSVPHHGHSCSDNNSCLKKLLRAERDHAAQQPPTQNQSAGGELPEPDRLHPRPRAQQPGHIHSLQRNAAVLPRVCQDAGARLHGGGIALTRRLQSDVQWKQTLVF
uniref:AJAP1/PANP C-terminal domain-containing protein n=1 Tax=Anas platyrhynchos TaxID=8839 RepID=A0A8B9TIC7_ANAPL